MQRPRGRLIYVHFLYVVLLIVCSVVMCARHVVVCKERIITLEWDQAEGVSLDEVGLCCVGLCSVG